MLLLLFVITVTDKEKNGKKRGSTKGRRHTKCVFFFFGLQIFLLFLLFHIFDAKRGWKNPAGVYSKLCARSDNVITCTGAQHVHLVYNN